MAEVVGGALLSAFLNPLVNKLTTEMKDFFKGKYVILKLLKELKTLLSTADLLLIDAEEKLIKEEAVKKWLDDLKDIIYDADDLVYMIETESWRNQQEGESHDGRGCSCTSSKVLMKLILSTTPLTSFDKDIKFEMEETLRKLKLLLENKDVSLERLKKYKLPVRACAPLLEESSIFGRDADKEEIMKLILSDDKIGDGGDKLSVIPIVGMGGIGKTTLAQLAYRDDRVDEKFDTKVWITVGDDKLDCMKVMRLIVEKLTSKKCEIEEPYDLQDEVQKALSMKKFLFVVDDVWDEDPTKWDVLNNSFKSGLHGSKIIVTTRSTIVASIVRTESIYQLKGISEVVGWQLFSKHASIDVDSKENDIVDLQEIGRRIVDKCNGLPLAIKSIANLLRGKHNKEEWENILSDDIWGLYERKNDGVLPALWLSYFYLPSNLKPCFAYCARFPKDYEFKKKEIILLWMAEGLLHSQNKKSVEEVGDGYFQDLISRSFFQQSSANESIFFMHDLIHDLAMFVSGEVSPKVRHLWDSSQHGEEANEHKNFEELFKANCFLRTLLLHRYVSEIVEQDWLSKLEHLHESFPRLRVLSIKMNFITKLPDSIGNLKYLRYLKLDCYGIKEIPNTICNLYNLETLLLKECRHITRLPTDIGNLTKLRHLRVHLFIKEMSLQFGKLQNLQTLNIFSVGENKHSGGLELLKDLQDLHGSLRIQGIQNVSNVEEVSDASLKSKKFLNKLSLVWEGDNDHDLDKKREILGALEPHPSLKVLEIFGYKGNSFPNWIGDHQLLSSLVLLTLDYCPNCSFLPSLGQLPSLKHLVIENLKNVVRIGSEFYYPTSTTIQIQTKKPFFRSLETLRFEGLDSLQEWSFIEGGVFPSLKKLYFDRCRRLKVSLFPDHFPLLRKLVIRGCEQLLPNLLAGSAAHTPFPNLEKLKMFDCGGQECFLEGGLPLSLKSIEIKCCDNLKYLDEGAFQRLIFLEKLVIYGCEKLQCLPKELPASLSHLHIQICKLLTRRVERETGEDWPVIAHIPNIYITT
ncbi:putative disease resistance RPP13-like protein 1 [Cannabis sativa]|uniref:putative disease resistance RPP13-like protein 1 n=1 Tax=Cannabis sativa TaxID=3483 RepID=UPI0029CA5CDC|nr:putative disease resistance RPP13-like protein 1 [Cannabis sativa]